MAGGEPGRAEPTDAEIEGRGVFGWLAHGLRFAGECMLESLLEVFADLVFGGW